MPKEKKAPTIQESGICTTRGVPFLPRTGRVVNVRTREEIRLDDPEQVARQERRRNHKRRYA